MELTIHTYGHIDAVFYVLNGIAMLTSGEFANNIIKLFTTLAALYYGLQAAYAGRNASRYIVKILVIALCINALILVKAEIYIVDHVSKKKEKVDNLPQGFALPVGLLEHFGYILLRGFEQAFTGVENFNYRRYGTIFGARLIKETREYKIRTPEFAENMHSFMRRCVIRDAMIGRKYSVDELLQSPNMWQLISSRAGTLRSVAMLRGGIRDTVSCREAALDYIAPAFLSETEKILARKSASFGAISSSSDNYVPRGAVIINNMLKKNLERVYSSYLGTNIAATDIIRQQFLINAISGIGTDYGYVRASMQQESNWKIAGSLAETYLPILLTVMKCLIYASFIFLVPMIIFGALGRYLDYLTVILSLQLWPVLNSVLNMFLDLYSGDNFRNIAQNAVSFATYSEIGLYADKIAAVSSGLQPMIPFLAFAIVRGGVGGFIHLAGNITGASSAAAASAAGEIVTGNRNFDNRYSGNMQTAMQTGFKTDFNEAYAAGASSYQYADGTMERTLVSGEAIYTGGAGMTTSGGSVKLNYSEIASSRRAEQLSNAQSLLESQQRSYAEVTSSVHDKTADFVKNLAQREMQGESFDYSSAGEVGESLRREVSNYKALKQGHGYNSQQEEYVDQKASLSLGTPGKSLFGGASFEAAAGASHSKASNQSLGVDHTVNEGDTTGKDYRNVIKAAASEQFSIANNIDKSYAETIRSSYNEQQALEKKMAKSHESVQSHSKALEYTRSKNASYDQDMYHQLEQNVAEFYNIPKKGAHDMIEHRDVRIMPIINRMIDNETSALQSAINTEKQVTNGGSAINTLDKFTDTHEKSINKNYTSHPKESAVNSGFNPDDENFLREDVEEKVFGIIQDNDREIVSGKWKNLDSKTQLTRKILKEGEQDKEQIIRGQKVDIDTDSSIVNRGYVRGDKKDKD